MSDKMEMTLGISLLMAEITEKLLYKVEEQDGKKVIVDRDIPFRLRYRLNKNLVMFNKDAQFFNQQKLLYLAHFGEPSEDGKNVVIKDEHKMELYKEAIGALVDSKVEHNIMTLEPEDLEKLEDSDIKISPEAMTLFIGYMTNDPELEKDLSYNIRINTPEIKEEPVKEEVKPVEEPAPVVEEPVVETAPVVEEAPKKKVTRKTTTKPKKAPTSDKEPKEEKGDDSVADVKKKAPAKSTTKKSSPRKKKEVVDGQ